MSSVGAALVILEEDEFESCLGSLEGFDEIGVLTDSPRLGEILAHRGCGVRVIERPQYIEEVGLELLSFAATDWLLLLDPDERLICPDLASLRLLLSASRPDIAGYWVDYRLSILGRPLERTYAGLAKSKLVRRNSVHWEASIHELPTPLHESHTFGRCPSAVAYVASDLMSNPLTRLSRHLQWATVEAGQRKGTAAACNEIGRDLQKVVSEYFVDRACLEDGMAGVLAGLLHLNKAIMALLLKASAEQEMEPSDDLAVALARFADALADASGG